MKDDIIMSTYDYKNRLVQLDNKTFKKHICIGHPEMKDNYYSIKQCTETPDFVYLSNQNENREVFYAKVETSTYPKLYTKVIIDYSDPKKGTIMSSWFEKTITGVRKEGLIYVKPKK